MLIEDSSPFPSVPVPRTVLNRKENWSLACNIRTPSFPPPLFTLLRPDEKEKVIRFMIFVTPDRTLGGVSESLTLQGGMERQIRSLHTVHDRRRARVSLGLGRLRGPRDRRGDVPDGLLLVRGVVLCVVRWQCVGAAEVERAPAVHRPRGRGADVDLLGGDGAVVPDLPRGDTEGFLAEHVVLCLTLATGFGPRWGLRVMTYGEDVGHTEDADDDARGDD